MLTGYIPFQGNTAFELIEQRVFKEPPKISLYLPQWAGSPLETLVDLCLKREPSQRFQSMAEIKQKLLLIRQRPEPESQTALASTLLAETGVWNEHEQKAIG